MECSNLLKWSVWTNVIDEKKVKCSNGNLKINISKLNNLLEMQKFKPEIKNKFSESKYNENRLIKTWKWSILDFNTHPGN